MAQQDLTLEKQPEQDQLKQSGEDEGIVFKPKTVTCEPTQHTFYYTASMSVKCRGCPIGYTLSPGSYLKSGHIYIGSQLLV